MSFQSHSFGECKLIWACLQAGLSTTTQTTQLLFIMSINNVEQLIFCKQDTVPHKPLCWMKKGNRPTLQWGEQYNPAIMIYCGSLNLVVQQKHMWCNSNCVIVRGWLTHKNWPILPWCKIKITSHAGHQQRITSLETSLRNFRSNILHYPC